jgi:hypothetical protein
VLSFFIICFEDLSTFLKIQNKAARLGPAAQSLYLGTTRRMNHYTSLVGILKMKKFYQTLYISFEILKLKNRYEISL